VIVDGQVDAVMHLASPASPKDFTSIPIKILKVGSLGTHNLLGLAKAKGARLFLASTSEVYGDPFVHPQPESYWGNVNPVGPRGVYDESKRFAEAMTMAYHRQHGLDVRIVRVFNSILATEQVLYDDGVELRREAAEVLAARLAGTIDLVGYAVPAFDREGRVRAVEASAFIGHPTTSACFEVRTRYGRSIKVTGDHSLFFEGPDGSPLARPVTAIQVGDRVAISGRVVVPVRDRFTVDLREVWRSAGYDPWELTLLDPGLAQEAWERRYELFRFIEAHHRPEKPRWRANIWSEIRSYRDRGTLPLGAAEVLGLDVTSGIRVRWRGRGHTQDLPLVVSITEDFLWLLGLYVAEGCWFEDPPKSRFITISCDSETLERATKILERDLGLHVVQRRGSESQAPAIFVHSRLLLLVLDHLGFGAGAKRIPGWILGLPLSRLKWFIEGYRVGDGVHSGKALAAGKRHAFSTTSEALKDDLIVALGRFGLVPSVGSYVSHIKARPGRNYPFWALTVSNVSPWSPLEWDRGVKQRLNARRFGDLVWAVVTKIVEVPPTDLVYDFCVPGSENFWAGTGLMAKNTYGPRMRPDDGRVVSNFVIQALRSEPLTVYGDGSQTRSFTYVDDEVRGFLALLDSGYVGPVNIGNPDEFTILELAGLVLELTKSGSTIEHRDLPVDDPTQRRPDITLARAVLGWAPEVPLRDGLERTIEWFRGRA
jgi:nucleoside-diphosphate-sugar epimerase